MTQTLYLDSVDELPSVLEGVYEDFRDIDYKPLLSDELNRFSDLHKRFFDSSMGPDGAPWKPNAPRTVRQKGHSTVLRGVRTSKRKLSKQFGFRFKTHRTRWIGGYRLATSLTARGTSSAGDAVREAIQTNNAAYLGFGTTVPYSIYNEDRPHVGMNESYLDGMVDRTADYVIEQLKKA